VLRPYSAQGVGGGTLSIHGHGPSFAGLGDRKMCGPSITGKRGGEKSFISKRGKDCKERRLKEGGGSGVGLGTGNESPYMG